MDKDYLIQLKERFFAILLDIGPLIVYAIVSFIAGIFLIKLIMRLLKRALKKSNIELSLKTFIESLSIFILYGLLFFAIGSILGIKSTSFLAIFGAAGIAVGLALQGSLSNFAGGILILVFKPFRVGDLIKVGDKLGEVQKIDILYTRIKTFDGRIITMPNGGVSNSDVDNRTAEQYRRIDLVLKFSFEEDIDRLRKIIVEALSQHPKVANHLDVDVWLEEIREYDMKVMARCWVESVEYWPLYWEQLEAVKKALDQAGIEIPIPKKEVHQAKEKEG
ncbi:MAG: mechanosensitive ion channel [Vicingaceae bacterium]